MKTSLQTGKRQPLRCGFTDVRKRSDGEFACSVCGRELGKDFEKIIAAVLPRDLVRKFRLQCAGPQL